MNTVVNIQFLRAVAAFSVLIYHFSLQYKTITGGELNSFYWLFNQIGYAGVDFFFVISGYIMWITTRKLTAKLPVAQFAYKRLTRIYLGYWPYFFLAILLITIFPNLTPQSVNLWGSFLLVEPHIHKLLIQVAWTLQFELYFYFIFTLLLLLPVSKRLVAIGLFAGAIIIYQMLATSQGGFTLSGFLLSPFCLQFFVGCFLGYYFEQRRINYKRFLVAGLSVLILAIYYQAKTLNQTLADNHYLIQRVLIFGTAAACIMAALIEMEKRGTQLFKNLSIILGGSSYSIYLSHTLAIALVYALGWQTWIQQNNQSPGWWIGLFMLLTVIYSVIHYLWVEKPLMALASHIRKRLFK